MARTRPIRYVGRASHELSTTLPDGTVVGVDETVEVEFHLARELLRAPGKADDTEVDWVPARGEI